MMQSQQEAFDRASSYDCRIHHLSLHPSPRAPPPPHPTPPPPPPLLRHAFVVLLVLSDAHALLLQLRGKTT